MQNENKFTRLHEMAINYISDVFYQKSQEEGNY